MDFNMISEQHVDTKKEKKRKRKKKREKKGKKKKKEPLRASACPGLLPLCVPRGTLRTVLGAHLNVVFTVLREFHYDIKR